MTKCYKCGLVSEGKACPACGTQLHPIQKQAPMELFSRTCTHCGRKYDYFPGKPGYEIGKGGNCPECGGQLLTPEEMQRRDYEYRKKIETGLSQTNTKDIQRSKKRSIASTLMLVFGWLFIAFAIIVIIATFGTTSQSNYNDIDEAILYGEANSWAIIGGIFASIILGIPGIILVVAGYLIGRRKRG